MKEKKGQSESRQKKGGSETEDGGTSGETGKKSAFSQRWSLVQSSSPITSEKNIKTIVKADRWANITNAERERTGAKDRAEVDEEKSSHCLAEEGISLGRKKKSAIKLGDVGRAMTVRKFIGKHKPTRVLDTEEEQKKPRDVKIWDEQLEKLALRKKRVSMICDTEIGVRNIRIIPSTPLMRNVAVKRRKEATHINLLVKEKASSDGHKGPCYDALGKVIPHSILGDVESFLAHSRETTKESNILYVHTAKTQEVETYTEKSSVIYYPRFSEENALRVWNEEMEIRHQQQNRLAGLLKCKESDLLMSKNEGHCPADIQVMLHSLRYHDSKYNPAVCFWKLGNKFTAGQLQDTLPKSSKDCLPTSAVIGDADSIIREKGKKCNTESGICIKDEYLKQQVLAMQGTIHVANKVLLNELLLQGEGIKLAVTDIDNARGDNEEQTRDAKLVMEKNDMVDNDDNKGRDQNSTRSMKFKEYVERDSDCEEAPSNDLCRRGTVYQDLVMTDQMSRLFNEKRRVFDFKIMGKERHELEGPAMRINGTAVQWCCNGQDLNCHCDSNAMKEVFVFIKGEEREVTRGYAKLENIGTTMIRYTWMRFPDNKPYAVQTPRRRCFYYMDDDGIMLPRETVYIPMLFRSLVAGYFTESWILLTQPLLEGGAKIKFTFKGIVTHVSAVSRQIQEVKEYLTKKETQTLCSLEANALVDYAVIKSSLDYGREREQQTIDEIFMQSNPGLHYHTHVIKRLQVLCESFIPETKQQKSENGQLLVSVSDLWEALHALPDDEDHDTCGVDGAGSNLHDRSYLNLARKQTLLWQLYNKIRVLCFRPLLPLQSSFKSKYIIMYSILQTGIDSMDRFAHVLAKELRLVSVKEVTNIDSVQKHLKGPKNKGKVQKTKGAMASPEQQQEVPIFSAVRKYRTDNVEKFSLVLAQYDEKVYLKVYSMLLKTVEEMSVLFENL